MQISRRESGPAERLWLRWQQLRKEALAGRLKVQGLIGNGREPDGLGFLTLGDWEAMEIDARRSELHCTRPGRDCTFFAVEVCEAKKADLPKLEDLVVAGLGLEEQRLRIVLAAWEYDGYPDRKTRSAQEAFERARELYGHHLEILNVTGSVASLTWTRAGLRRDGLYESGRLFEEISKISGRFRRFFESASKDAAVSASLKWWPTPPPLRHATWAVFLILFCVAGCWILASISTRSRRCCARLTSSPTTSTPRRCACCR